MSAPVDVWEKLAAPLNAADISWRQDGKPVNRNGRFVARFVCYVEAGTVRERLDSVVPGEWDLTIHPFGEAISIVTHEGSESIFCVKARLRVLGVLRECIGQGDDLKQAATDAFKRAAVRFGIGHELYNMGQNWVEVDGDGKYAKPVEDPQQAYERKNGANPSPPQGRSTAGSAASANAPATPTTSAPTSRALDEESCPKCGGRMHDNRLTKRNPKAPDWKCKDRSCDGVIWPPKAGEKKEPVPAGNFDDFPAALDDQEDSLPF